MDKLKNKLILLGVGVGIATGISAYFAFANDFLTIAERDALIREYNQQLTTIKNNCDTDIRCVIQGGEKRVRFDGVKSKKDVFKKLNTWIEERGDPKYRK